MAGGVITAAWVQGLCTLVPTTGLAVTAFYGLRAWRPQARGQRAIERAEQCLTALHETIDFIRAVRSQAITVMTVGDESGSLQKGIAALREEDIQRAWQSWHKFSEAYRRAGFYIQMPKNNDAQTIAGVILKLSGLSRLIETYSGFDEDKTTYASQFKQRAVEARSEFLGFTKDGSERNDEDPIESTLQSAIKSLETILIPITRG